MVSGPSEPPGMSPGAFSMGERLDSNQQPTAYEAAALPLSYAPKISRGQHTRGNSPGRSALEGAHGPPDGVMD